MSLFSKLLNALKGKPPSGSDRYIPIYVYSNRCREPLAAQIDIMNEISRDDDYKGYFVRKVLHTSGKNRCYGQVEIEVWLDSEKRIVRQEVTGGRWLTQEEYQAELARQAEAAEEEAEPQNDPDLK